MPDKNIYNEPELVSCELCGKPTAMIRTKRCNRCWELERRIQENPELARRILVSLS